MTPPTGEEPDILKDITELYCYYKELSLFAEEIRTESFLPPINEIRDAFDHLMRTCAVQYGFKVGNGDYKQENLKATFRHLYRAVFDLLDYIRIYEKLTIYEKIKGFSKTAILDVFPEYYREIVPEIEKCVKTIPIYKMDKDIGDPNLTKVKEYVDLVKKMRDYSLLIDEKIPAISLMKRN